MNEEIGMTAEDKKRVAAEAAKLLATSYTLMLKTQNFHWNVTGPMFQSLHAMFELQYTELFTAVDEIAERIRALGEPAPGGYGAFGKLSAIADSDGVPTAEQMVKQLAEGHEVCANVAREVLINADECDDVVTADLATQRINVHDKTAWMLRSSQ